MWFGYYGAAVSMRWVFQQENFIIWNNFDIIHLEKNEKN